MNEFSRRRKELLKKLPRGTVVVIPAAERSIRNGGIEYPFRQDSNFSYLTGFPESSAVAVLISGVSDYEYILFCAPYDRERDVWEGECAGCEGAVKMYGADKSYPITDFENYFPTLIKNCHFVYWTESEQSKWSWLSHLKRLCASVDQVCEFYPVAGIIGEMRLFKSAAEIKVMKKAAAISAKAHCQAMRYCRPGRYEYEIEAVLLREFHAAGTVPAYSSIVGGGANACVLHYIKNASALKDGDLLLVDAGAEYREYASDISRTYPVNGKFTTLQRELYEVVLEAQTLAIRKVKVGNYFNDFHQTAVLSLTRGLVNIGLLKGNVSTLIKEKAYQRFYMHNTGHWLGMDVHDTGAYYLSDNGRRLERGMVLTVEPGIYIRAAHDIAKRWWNTGIRIEDDVLVSSRGPEVISDGVPRTPTAIEHLMTG